MTDREFCWAHLRTPLFAFIILAVLSESTSLDVLIAHRFFYDESHSTWLGANSWWINQFLHTGGRWTMRFIVLLSLLVWIATFMDARMRRLRRASGYLCLGMIASVAVVGLLKTLTNVDCPWDLTQFGGNYPWVGLFADRADDLRHGRCFPAAHASSGYALMAVYFAFREYRPNLAKWGLALGLATGIIFGVAQQARGAHFLSHDVWSAFLVWLILLSLYVFGFKRRLHVICWQHGRENDAAENRIRRCTYPSVASEDSGQRQCSDWGRQSKRQIDSPRADLDDPIT